MKVQGRRKRGSHKRRWLDRVKDDIKEKGLMGRNCTTVLHSIQFSLFPAHINISYSNNVYIL